MSKMILIEEAKVKQALEALESVLCDPDGNVCWQGSYADRDIIGDALDIFRAAIAEAEKQEPVAWIVEDQYGKRLEWSADSLIGWGNRTQPLYTHPPKERAEGEKREWQGLTDEQKLALCKQFPDHLTFNAIKAIEAAHGIKE